jgi:hypothetical protein
METKGDGSSCSNREIHICSIPPTFAQHVECHKEIRPDHIQVGILYHFRQSLALRATEECSPDVLRVLVRLTLCPNSDYQIQACSPQGAQMSAGGSAVPSNQGTLTTVPYPGLEFRRIEDIDERFRLRRSH